MTEANIVASNAREVRNASGENRLRGASVREGTWERVASLNLGTMTRSRHPGQEIVVLVNDSPNSTVWPQCTQLKCGMASGEVSQE